MVVSERRLQANRRNALLSTGPKTYEGKAVSCRNGITHGLNAKDPVLPHEDRADFERVVYLYAQSGWSEFSARRIAAAVWRLRRIHRLRCAILEIQQSPGTPAASPDHEIAHWLLERHSDPLAVLKRYQVMLERRYCPPRTRRRPARPRRPGGFEGTPARIAA